MIKSLPGFIHKPKGEDSVIWYQKARGYPATGNLTPDQRRWGGARGATGFEDSRKRGGGKVDGLALRSWAVLFLGEAPQSWPGYCLDRLSEQRLFFSQNWPILVSYGGRSKSGG